MKMTKKLKSYGLDS